MKKKIISILVCVITVISIFSTDVFADYTVSDGEIQHIPQSYVYVKTLNILKDVNGNTVSSFNQPLDMYISGDDKIYVADTSNNRVVCMDSDGNFLSQYTSANGVSLNSPKGICVSKDGTVYIADTGNSRIVSLDGAGNTVNVFENPKSSLLNSEEAYTPTKISVSPSGSGIYVLMGENIMNLDDKNNVRGFVGQTDVGFKLLDWFLRTFATEEQRNNIEKRTGASYDNFHIDDNGLIYAVSRDSKEGQIKVLNTVGNNIYKKISAIQNESNVIGGFISRFFSGNIISKSFRYGELYENSNAVFSDICVNADGIISVIQTQNGHIYQYDNNGNLLTVFGGFGTNQGEFSIPVSICTDSKGYIYVLDSSYGNIQIFKPTEFILDVQAATNAMNNNDLKRSGKLWRNVLERDDTYSLAYRGLGSVYYADGKWEKAMECFKLSNDRKEYSKAFNEWRFEWIESHVGWVFLGVAVFAVLLYLLISFLSGKSRKTLHSLDYDADFNCNLKNGMLLATGMIFRPFATLESIKDNRRKIRTGSCVFILVLLFAVRMFFVFTASYLMRDTELENVNVLLEAVKLFVPIFTFIISGFLISEQFDGEATLKECFVTATYAMLPYAVVNTFAALVSHILCWNEKGFFALLVNGVTVWCVFLLILSVKIMNGYSIKNTIKVSLVVLCAMVLIWFSLMLGYSVVARVFALIGEIVNELGLLMG